MIKDIKAPNNFDVEFISDIAKESFSTFGIDNSFLVFKAINDIYYLIYANIKNAIIIYNLISNNKINEIINAHNKDIINFRHFLDEYKKRDIIMTISFIDNNIKLWDVKNFECILNLQNVNSNGNIKTACFINDNNNIFIVTSNYNGNTFINLETIKIFNLDGSKIKEIDDSNNCVIFISVYYDKISSKNFVIAGNNGSIKSYDYTSNKIYYKYIDGKNDYYDHTSIVIIDNDNDNIIKIVESCGDGIIRIWNFHSGILLNKIKVSYGYLFSICLYNNYLFIGCREQKVKILDIKEMSIIKEIEGFNQEVITLKIFSHPALGKCLLVKGKFGEEIKLWKIKA